MFLVVAWDGADLDLIEPWLERGELPTLASLLERSAVRCLESTRPPVTFPAWTSFLTAATPDRHGVSDFTIRDGYRLRFVNASDRRIPTVFSLMADAGLRVGTYGVPATHPPEALTAFQIPGFDTPFGASPDASTSFPPGLGRRIVQEYGSLGVEGPDQVRIEDGWHANALRLMLATVAKRTRIFVDLIEDTKPACAMIHFMESDTVSHQFRQYCDPHSPHYEAGRHDDAMLDVYRALDSALARLLDAVGPNGAVMLLSDHGGAPSSDRAICWNRWLADHGRLRFRDTRSTGFLPLAKRLAIRWLPRTLHARVFAALRGAAGRVEGAARFAGIDWHETDLFCDESGYQAAFWLNLQGREPEGRVGRDKAADVLAALERDLVALRDPFDGGPVVETVWRREQLFDGPYAGRIPDLLADLRRPEGLVYSALPSRGGHERRVFRRLSRAEMTGARGRTMPGAHAPLGLCALSGRGVRAGRYATGTLHDAGATLLAMHGIDALAAMNGRPWTDCLVLPLPVAAGVARPGAAALPAPYSLDEEVLVADRLRALGYIG